ncbi:SH3 domain-containing protein [Actinosynnema sp. NPDC050436]|uniref:SH3 domain-containing protein n=1 Tax=Actinosynnema sp. NPDC050436 TaxID=3155659 RepID=UPI0033CDDA56
MNTITRVAVAVAAVAVPAVLLSAPAGAAPKGDGVTPQHWACGSGTPPNHDPISGITGANAGARIRTGSSTSCTALGSSQPSDRLDYYCYTRENGTNATWTYLRNGRTGVRGWTRDDQLPGGGSNYFCGS